jgi:hypothetical protein
MAAAAFATDLLKLYFGPRTGTQYEAEFQRDA